ncbi:MAG: hypothetical protein ACR2O0_05370 [Rhizobiaceae bacterium]
MSDQIPHLNFVCFKWGTAYPSSEVNILRAMVRRNTSIPHTFHCVTDNAAGLDPEIEVYDLPDDGSTGFNKKLSCFSTNFLGLQDQFIVVLDIDLVIVNSIDFLADNPDVDYFVTQDFATEEKTHTAVFRLRVGSHAHVWDNYIKDPVASDNIHPERLDRDQFWVEYQIPDRKYFPREKIVSFKYHCNGVAERILGKFGSIIGLTTAHFGIAEVPKDAAIISFHGIPLPRDVKNGRYMHYRHAPFVASHWRQ